MVCSEMGYPPYSVLGRPPPPGSETALRAGGLSMCCSPLQPLSGAPVLGDRVVPSQDTGALHSVPCSWAVMGDWHRAETTRTDFVGRKLHTSRGHQILGSACMDQYT